MLEYKINPFIIIIEELNKKYPDLDAEIFFVPAAALYDEGEPQDKPRYGVTAEGIGGRKIIYVSEELPAMHCIEIIGHEVAHILAGFDAGHGAEWERAFDEIYDLYNDAMEKKMAELDEGVSDE